jgi:dihydrodipicolinate synthase/N-acetylneuraminate lyase
MKEIKGVLPALITPFTDSGKLHRPALRNHVEFLIEKGVGGLYACGTFGAGPLLSAEEHMEFSSELARIVDGRVPVIVHVGTTTIRETVRLAKHCEAAGVDAVASVPPYYYQHTEDVVLRFYGALFDSVSIPVFAYNNPPQVGYALTPEMVAKLADMGAYGIKDSSFDIKVFNQFMGAVKQKDFVFICGTVPIFYAALTMGAAAGVGGPANVFPEIQIELYEELQKGNLKRCAELQQKMLRLVKIQGIGGIPFITLINMLELRGVEYGAHPHDPWTRLPTELGEEIRAGLEQEGLI